MIRVADYIANFISDHLGLKDVFMLTGAGIMHLTDGVACNKKLRAICVHHEQSASMALEAYARANEDFAVGYFSTGPAALNALTGLGGAWQDSVPCLFISGQVKRSEAGHNAGIPGLRQFGVQELDIIPVVSSLCKYAVHLNNPTMVRYELEKAVDIAKSGRPGPVWFEVPMDVQATMIDPDMLDAYEHTYVQPAASPDDIQYLLDALQQAQRPVIVAGRGVRLAGAQRLLQEFATTNKIPVVTPYLGIDNLRHDLDVYIGKTGVKGDRPANFTMQNADLILAIGTSLHVSVIGYEYEQFARAAKKIVVDIDPISHKKKTIKIDRLIESDAKVLLDALMKVDRSISAKPEWLARCVEWKKKYPVCLPEYKDTVGAINIYSFVDRLSALSGPGDMFVSDAGSAFYAVSQGIQLKKDRQRYIPSGAMATMGYTLPAAIGVSAATGDARVLAVTGDGSLQQNIQELQTLLHYNLPVKLFVLNNDGYLSIRASQKNYFKERYIGEGSRSGVTMPDTLRICEAYGIPAARVSDLANLDRAIQLALDTPGPYVLDIVTPPEQLIIPTVSSRVNPDGSMSSRPLEDMAPFLDRDEYHSNLLIDEV
ncbi:MAG: thiamine pyrophosphate-binding protein [Gammaproteobacteria bacterium]|nr:thiamine pyrophosphate-binding protein [Gammaproteobacteria bacterium]MBU1406941.1 thiamine pyrophosphate-binding protein [Gammaproteobacteria bacterium]MBU1533084.1 thiamine pyrophosphate-binding protein [Gammaproteobacteria bacterium]